MILVGKRLLLRYESGLEVQATYHSASSMTWEALAGPAKGTRGTENITTAEVAPQVFFVSWVEKSGTTVSNVIDLVHSRVSAFVTFETPEGRQSVFDKGTLAQGP